MNSKIAIVLLVSMVYLVRGVEMIVCNENFCDNVKVMCEETADTCALKDGILQPPNPRECRCCARCVTKLSIFSNFIINLAGIDLFCANFQTWAINAI